MSLPLLKENIRGSWKLLVIFLAVISMYVGVMMTMYDPGMNESLTMMVESMPELMAAFGMTAVTGSLASFLANYLYGFLLLVFPMVFAVMLCNKLVARHVDRGSMAWLVASPNSRGRVALTQAVTVALAMLMMALYAAALAVALAEAMFPGELDIAAYLRLNVGLFCLLLAVSAIAFLASCVFNESKNAIAVGAGIPVLFLLVQMLSNMGDKLENLKYATLLTLFDTEGLLAGTGSAWAGAAALAVLALVLYGAGITIFRRRNLPL